MIDQKLLTHHTQITRRSMALDKLLTVAMDGSNYTIGAAGYQGDQVTSITDIALDLLRTAETLLPTGMTVVVMTAEGAIEIRGGDVVGVHESRDVELDG